MYQARAGRRAGATSAPITTAVDPLADPTPSVHVEPAQTAPAAVSTAPTAPPSAVSWLDEPEPIATSPAAAPSPTLQAVPKATTPTAAPLMSNQHIGSFPTGSSQGGPSWLGDGGDEFETQGVAPSPQYSTAAVAAPSVLHSPTNQPSPVVAQPARSAAVSPFSPNAVAPSVALPPALQAASTITYTYSDDTTLVAQLTAELAAKEQELNQLTESVNTLTSHTHPDWVSAQESAGGLASLKQQVQLAAEAKRQNEEQHATKLKFAKDRHEVAVAEIRRMAGAVVTDEQEAAVASLQAEVKQAEASVTKQREVLQQKLLEMENATLNSTANSTAQAQLAALVGVLIRDERGKVRRLARSVLHDETRGAVDVVREERHEALDAARTSRRGMLEEHIRSRKDAFQLSRQKSQRDRQESTDKLFATIKHKLLHATEEKRARAKSMVKDQVERMQRDAASARAETSAALERIVAGQDADRAASTRGAAAREEDLRLRLLSLEQHTVSVQQAEEESLKRLGEKWFEEDGKRQDPFNLVFVTSKNFLTQGGHALDADTQTKLMALIEHIRSSVAAVRIHGDQNSEVLKLTRQREEVVKELQQHIHSSKDSLQRSWHHLESLLTKLSTAADSFEKSVRQSRTEVTVSQQQVDATRAAWESDVRQRLSTVFLESTAGTVLPQSPFHVVEDTMYQIGCSLREMQSKCNANKRVRSQFVRDQSVAADVLREKQLVASKLVGKVLDTFQELAQANATLTTKTAWVEAEEQDARNARDQLESEKAAFQSAVALARDVADRLREQAENVPPSRATHHDGEEWNRPSHYHTDRRHQQQHRRPETHTGGHITDKDKYRHLYTEEDSSHHSNSSQQQNPHRTFQSLVLLDSTVGNDLSRYPQQMEDGSIQSSPAQPELMRVAEVVGRASSSGSSDARGADKRRLSLTTPSISESGRV